MSEPAIPKPEVSNSNHKWKVLVAVGATILALVAVWFFTRERGSDAVKIEQQIKP